MIQHLDRILDEMVTDTGASLSQLHEGGEVLLVFLRFFGCTFCREAISDLSLIKDQLDEKGVRIVFVHMSRDQETPDEFFARYNLKGVAHISDPSCYFYRLFGLVKATPGQLVSFGNWVRGFQSAVVAGHGIGRQSENNGDGFQMPGVFYLENKKVKNAFIHKMPFDRPDYMSLVQ
jgi:peroxiredoxin